MSNDGISVPAIQVNNDTVGLVPNSYKSTRGSGETNVRAVSIGGGSATAVHTRNAETMFSKVMFQIYVTVDNLQLIDDWKANGSANTISASQRGLNGKDYAESYKNMSMINDPEINAAADGVIDIEMAGDQILQS